MLFLLITRWSDASGECEPFERKHERKAASIEAAIRAEESHNGQRSRDGMFEDGWRWTIVSCDMAGTQ